MIVSKKVNDDTTTITVVTATGVYERKDIPPSPIDSKDMTGNLYDEVGDLVVIPMHNVKKIIFHY